MSGQRDRRFRLLGYIGSVNECELVRQNSARSLGRQLARSIGHAEECGIITKQIAPTNWACRAMKIRIGSAKTGLRPAMKAICAASLAGIACWSTRAVRAPT